MLVNDLTPYAIVPAPATPAAGGTFTDPLFQTTILRVTDASDGPGFVTEYGAIWDMFNIDSSYFYYTSLTGDRIIAQLDVVNRKVSNKRALDKAILAQYWSRLKPHILYAVEGWQAAKIWQLDVSTWTWTLIVDLTTVLPIVQTPNTSWVGSRGMSWNDNRFHLNFGAAIGVGIYDVAQKRMLGPITLAQAQVDMPGLADYAWEKTSMDASGTYVCTTQTTATVNGVVVSNSAELLCNILTGQFFSMLFGYTPSAGTYPEVHQDFAGHGLMADVGGLPPPGPNSGFFPTITGPVDPNNLSTYLTLRKQIGPQVPWTIDSHSSFRDASVQWALFTYDGSGAPAPFQPGEIFELSVASTPDGGINRRICQAYSNPASVNQPYEGVPFASQSQDNRCAGFHSTYQNSRLDVYIAFLDIPAPPVRPSGQLAGVLFTQDEAVVLQQFALSQLSLKKG